MASYKGKSRQIKDALITVLSGIQLDAGSGPEPAFLSVLDTATGEFDGYPSIRVLPGQVDTTKSSVSQNDRAVAFIARVHLPLEAGAVDDDPATREHEAINKMYDLTD